MEYTRHTTYDYSIIDQLPPNKAEGYFMAPRKKIQPDTAGAASVLASRCSTELVSQAC